MLIYDAIVVLIIVSIIASRLTAICMRMVTVVEPLAQRNQPNSSPNRKICVTPIQLYWMYSSDQTSETMMIAWSSRPWRASPR